MSPGQFMALLISPQTKEVLCQQKYLREASKWQTAVALSSVWYHKFALRFLQKKVQFGFRKNQVYQDF